MKYIFAISLLLLCWCCSQHTNNTIALQDRIDSLENKLTNRYTPGFGEFMSSIQTHHSKLWFAGLNENWKLADFEMHEIKEGIENIQLYQAQRTESRKIVMLLPAMDSVNNAILRKNVSQFKNSFVYLTNTCNSCHRAVNFEFNVVKIPEVSPFTNQDFGVKK